MRDVQRIRTKITDDVVAAVGRDGLGMEPHDFFDVEVALFTLVTVAPGQISDGVPALLDGHGSIRTLGDRAALDAKVRISNARLVVGKPVSPYRWAKDLAAYRDLPQRVRGFKIDEDGVVTRHEACSVAAGRFTVLEDLLTKPLPFALTRNKIAGAGRYKIASTTRRLSVDIRTDLPFPVARASYPDDERRPRGPLTVTWADLEATAKNMDHADALAGRVSNDWLGRMQRSAVKVRGLDHTFSKATDVTVDGVLHMAGMVSAGKTTLIQVLAIWAAQNGYRTTVVLGDNSAVLDMVADLNRYVAGAAAPVLGQSGRERHLKALHKRKPPATGELVPQDRESFEWTSTACALAALVDTDKPLGVSEAPCESLIEYDEKKDDGSKRAWHQGPKMLCPLWHGCQRHEASRSLVDAPIWVATHWGLTYSRLPAAMSKQQMRYLEAAWRRSDLFVVDEADRVQTGLDGTFSRSQPLFGRGRDAWVDQISTDVTTHLRNTARGERKHLDVRNFTGDMHRAQGLGDILYNLMQRDAQSGGVNLNAWMGPEYFTSWTLSARLCSDLTGYDPRKDDPTEPTGPPPSYEVLRAGFNAYIDTPHAEADGHEDPIASSLAELNHFLLVETDEERRSAGFRTWVEGLDKLPGLEAGGVVLGDARTVAMRVELCMVAALFSHYLNQMLYGWPTVARLLELDGDAYQQSPRDLRPLIPESPMGTVLGFQYVAPQRTDGDAAGELHFFEATGIGRALLLELPNLFPAEGRGPNVILLSGTSWAGTSPRYHIDHQVDAILEPEASILAGIEQSEFEVLLQRSNPSQRPLRVSGVPAPARLDLLRQLVGCLLRPHSTGKSQIEQVIDQLPEKRKKILLLVGSYAEAQVVHAAVEQHSTLRSRYLVSDSSADDAWLTDAAGRLPRGDVATFGQSDDDVLIAPLLAVERGHNILNSDRVAAIGAAFFLVRPHPSPQDIGWVTQSLNHRAMQRRTKDVFHESFGPNRLAMHSRDRRRRDQGMWRGLLQTEIVYSRLYDKPRVREALIWTQIVTMWQVIGRLVRGGQPARIYFCDAAFTPGAERGRKDTAATSILLGMREALGKYCSESSTERDRHLVTDLYGPLFRALTNMKGI